MKIQLRCVKNNQNQEKDFFLKPLCSNSISFSEPTCFANVESKPVSTMKTKKTHNYKTVRFFLD